MRTQSATTGVNARGNQVDLQQYDQKLKPSPLVPRNQLKKESAVNQAFMHGFIDELDKNAALGAVAGTVGKALKSAGGVKGLGQKALSHGKTMLKDPFTQMQIGQSVMGKMQERRQGSQAAQASRSGQLGVAAKKPTGLVGGLGLSGAQ